jgi:hypothetical protein
MLHLREGGEVRQTGVVSGVSAGVDTDDRPPGSLMIHLKSDATATFLQRGYCFTLLGIARHLSELRKDHRERDERTHRRNLTEKRKNVTHLTTW